MYLFDIENTDKVINLALNVENPKIESTQMSSQKGMISIKFYNFIDSFIKRNNYGNKWYLNPKFWNKAMNQTREEKEYQLLNYNKE